MFESDNEKSKAEEGDDEEDEDEEDQEDQEEEDQEEEDQEEDEEDDEDEDQEYEDEEDEEDEDEEEEEEDPGEQEEAPAPAPQRRKGRKRGTRFLECDPDNDPKKAPRNPNFHKRVEADGWNPNLTQMTQQDFIPSGPQGPTFRTSPIMTPVQYFLQFFSLNLFVLIAGWTNDNMRRLGVNATTSMDEIKAWFGIRLIMGLVKVSNAKDYWSTHPGYRNILISRTMSKNRFNFISSHITCCSPHDDLERLPERTQDEKRSKKRQKRNAPFWPIRSLWEEVLRNCQTKYRCVRDLSIDEAMVRYKGFKSTAHKFFMPLKPIGTGFKIYALCEATTGYMTNFKTHITTYPATKIDDLTSDLASTVEDRNHHIYTDKFYTSIPLAQRLLNKKIYLTGSIKLGRKGLPKSLLSTTDKMTRLKRTRRGTYYCRQKDNMTFSVWKDSRVATMLSTFYNGYRNLDTDRIRRKFSKDGIDRKRYHMINVPPSILAYTQGYYGVDRADQLRAYYTAARKSQSWWKQLLFFLIDISQVNAWICFKHADAATRVDRETRARELSDDDDDDDEDDSPMPRHSEFIMDIATGLIDGYQQGTVRQLRDFGGVDAQYTIHRLVRVDSCLACRHCKNNEKKTPSGKPIKTRSTCQACGIHLCKKDCFIRYHSLNGVRVQGPADFDEED
ncbi:piggyBac transposable element-derived protein 4-like [Amphiura filiformis]|uniref:piggyBac transposable element-derived protein 4-like n=1 Tax=Amphiura filiformis TaxID=82378 RepID=UPI003B21F830